MYSETWQYAEQHVSSGIKQQSKTGFWFVGFLQPKSPSKGREKNCIIISRHHFCQRQCVGVGWCGGMFRSRPARYLLSCLTVCLMAWYLLHSHSKYQQHQHHRPTETNQEENHTEILQKRSLRVKKICRELNNPLKPEQQTFFYTAKSAPSYFLGTHFQIKQRSHFLCTPLKAGSSSWEAFFSRNKITNTKIFDCHMNKEKCPESPDVKIIQVRHPFVRLLSAYRYVFKKEGWKLGKVYKKMVQFSTEEIEWNTWK